METNFSVSKSTVECYKIRGPHSVWADITIDAQGRQGRIQIASDYGSWQNYWGACGSDFKSFLASLNKGYVENKFGVEDWVDVPATIRHLKRELFEARREEFLDADNARCVYDDIEALEDHNHKEMESGIASTHYLSDFLNEREEYQPLQYRPNPHFARFWEELWPVLLAEFKREAETVAAE